MSSTVALASEVQNILALGATHDMRLSGIHIEDDILAGVLQPCCTFGFNYKKRLPWGMAKTRYAVLENALPVPRPHESADPALGIMAE